MFSVYDSLRLFKFSYVLLGVFNPNSYRSSRSEVFLVKGVLKICSKFTGEHPCRSVISTSKVYVKLLKLFYFLLTQAYEKIETSAKKSLQ